MMDSTACRVWLSNGTALSMRFSDFFWGVKLMAGQLVPKATACNVLELGQERMDTCHVSIQYAMQCQRHMEKARFSCVGRGSPQDEPVAKKVPPELAEEGGHSRPEIPKRALLASYFGRHDDMMIQARVALK